MLGVCYYPEQWPEAWWADDAASMRDMGLSFARIGEFAWSALEPEPGRYDWAWMDRAIATLAREGIGVVLGTPTATPPRWLVERTPDMLAFDRAGRVRGFGSRRHYCFSSANYRAEALRITEAMAKRYGEHPAVIGWQTDNEFGCHDTTRSYSPMARAGFRDWLRQRYQSPAQLNEAWGNRFWSMELGAFSEAELPNLTVTEPNPAHMLDFARFSSDQVAAFNAGQTEILRAYSPGRWITHNFMGAVTDFDHFKLARDLDLASWDSYPLGFTDSLPHMGISDEERLAYAETGHPDMSAFHHDLYRGVGRGRFMVMEQQPGPVNWARWNPAPRKGQVRLWSWEALAHGAESVCYFRWRQAPFAQEQMHAGLNRPDRVRDQGGIEAAAVAAELRGPWWPQVKTLTGASASAARVALVFDYESVWCIETQKQGADYHPLAIHFAWYQAARHLGLDVDIVPPGADLKAYALVLAPCLPLVSDAALASLTAAAGEIVLGPRAGSKLPNYRIPDTLPPGALHSLIPMKVLRVESLRPKLTRGVRGFGLAGEALRWAETLEPGPDTEVVAQFASGAPAVLRKGRVSYCGAWLDRLLTRALIETAAQRAGLNVTHLPEGVRRRTRGGVTFVFNSSAGIAPAGAPAGATFHLGGPELKPSEIAAFS